MARRASNLFGLPDRPVALAFGTCPVGAVETKSSRFDLRQTDRASHASESSRVELLLVVGQGTNKPRGQLQCTQDCLFNPFLAIFPDHDPIDDRFDGVLLADRQFRYFVELKKLSIDADFEQTGLFDFAEDLRMSPFSVQDHRSHDRQLGPPYRSRDGPDDRFGGLPQNWLVALVARGYRDASHEESEIVVDFGDRPDGTPRALNTLRLVDAQAWLQAPDRVEFGPLQLVEKLTRVTR